MKEGVMMEVYRARTTEPETESQIETKNSLETSSLLKI